MSEPRSRETITLRELLYQLPWTSNYQPHPSSVFAGLIFPKYIGLHDCVRSCNGATKLEKTPDNDLTVQQVIDWMTIHAYR